jgi:predicted ester cyclase
MASSAFSLNPYNEYDSFYEQDVRKNLGTFHINLSHGNYSANGPLCSPSIHWNVNGLLLISRASFVTRLTGFNTTFHGLQVPDVYHIVDGNVGAVLYHLQGPQTGNFEGIAVSGRSINVLGGELMVFDKNALLWDLISVEEISLAERQLLGEAATPTSANNLTGLLVDNPQTSPEFRSRSRRVIASIHENYNAGNNAENSKLVAKDVQINADWVISSGPDAFLDFVGMWSDSFPELVYHDDHVIADGHLGALEFVWEGAQTGNYKALNGTVLPPSGKVVRVRGFIFFEFENDGLITKVTGVHNEGSIEDQLNSGSLYP